MRRAATILALTAVFLVGVGAAIAIVNDTNASLWATLEQSSMWRTYSKQNPNEAARVKTYWLNGGAKPSVATKFGTFLVEVNEDRVGTQPPPPPPPTTGTTTTTPTPPPPTGTFPNAASTGVPSGTNLTAYTGPSTVSTANTVIDGKTIGCLVVTAPGVVIKNSRVNCTSSFYAVYVDDRTSQSTVLTIQDSEISCGNTNNIGVGEADYTLTRVEITGCENGLDINQNVLVQDSFIHNLTTSGGDPHTDGAQLADHYNSSGTVVKGAINVTFRHNTIFGMGGNDTVFGTSAIIQNVNATDSNVTIDNNLLAGGAYTLYCHSPGPAVNNRITNNHFSTRFKATVGYFGPTDGCGDEAVVSGNVIDETGQPVNMG